jgi:glycosyltransferase involved in cell wall biosynthesis
MHRDPHMENTEQKTKESGNIRSTQESLRIQVFCDDPSSNITQIRLGEPLMRLAEQFRKEIRFTGYKQMTHDDLAWGDVIIIQRAYSPSIIPLIARAQKMGKPVIYEIDDLLIDIPKFLSHHTGYVRKRKSIIRMLKLCDAISVTQPRLRDALLQWNSNIFICPNYANPKTAPTKTGRTHTDEGPKNLVLASSDRIRIDFLVPALEKLQKTYRERVNLIVIGNLTESMKKSNLKYESIGIIPINEFTSFIAGHQNAIGLIPLDDSKFSSCKSAVKYFDYTQAGAAVICSNVSPYRDVISNGTEGILTENTTDAWVKNISRLIDNAGLRNQLVAAAQDSVEMSHNIENTVKHWQFLFESIAPGNRTAPLLKKNLSLSTILALAYGRLSELNKNRRLKRSRGALVGK